MNSTKLNSYHQQLNTLFEIIEKDEIFLNDENEKMFNDLLKLEKRLYRLFEKNAMGIIDDEIAEKEYKRLIATLDKISKALKFKYFIQSDLRGYIIRIGKEEITEKNYIYSSFPLGVIDAIK